ncbi:MAG: shikimate kinase [Bacteroidota bacterium]
MKKSIRMAVAGKPVMHSLSPQIFACFPDDSFSYTRFAAGSAEEIFRFMEDFNLDGINITSPFKQDVFNIIKQKDDSALRAGAVNLLTSTAAGISGYNTDINGAKEVAANFSKNDKIVIYGYGASARAAGMALHERKIPFVFSGYGPDKGRQTAERLGKKFINENEIISFKPTAIMICIPRNIVPAFLNSLEAGTIIYDVNYNNPILSEAVQVRNLPYYDGLRWLFGQARESARLITGSYPKAEIDIETIISRPEKIILTGFMGAGKNTIAKQLSDELGYEYADTDDLIAAGAGISIPEIFNNYGENEFRDLESRILNRILDSRDRLLISAGGGIIERAENHELIKERAMNIYLHASFDVCESRINGSVRPLFKDRDTAAGLYQKRLYTYFDASDMSILNEGPVENCLKRLKDELSAL